VPVTSIRVGGFRVPIGDASNGLCGGMAFVARDLFEAGLAPPPLTEAPGQGAPLFDYLVARLFDSFDLPGGPGKYLLWQSLPDRSSWFGLTGLIRRTSQEWPAVKADIDAERLAPLGLIRTRSFSPWQLGRNHQVLAYAYDLNEASSVLTIRVYDPNHHDDDSVTLEVNLADPARHWPIAYVEGEDPVRGFFRATYRPPEAAQLAAALV
jgi:hypothetical protein